MSDLSYFDTTQRMMIHPICQKYHLDTDVVTYVHRSKGLMQERDLHLVIIREQAADNRPVLVWVKGSGWCRQNMFSCFMNMHLLAAMGYVVACVEYRNTDENGYFPSQIEDCKQAIRYMREHAREFGGNSEQICVGGDSSGAHTALLAGMTCNCDAFDDGNRDENNFPVSASVKGIIAYYPPCDPTDPYGFPQAPGGAGSAASNEGRLMGRRKLSDIPEEAGRGIVMNYVELDFPPVFLQHGTADDIVVCRHSVRLDEALRHVGKDCRFELVEGAGHADKVFFSSENFEKVSRFLQEQIQ